MRIRFTLFALLSIFCGFHARSARAQWERTNVLSGAVIVNCIVAEGGTLFAGTELGVFSSTNDGTDWNDLNISSPVPGVTAIAANGNAILTLNTAGQLYLTRDNGVSWQESGNGIGAVLIYTIEANNGIFFAGTDMGVFHSTDNGLNWNNTSTSVLVEGAFTLGVNDTTIYVGTNYGIYSSTDTATTWTAVGVGLDSAGIINAILAYDTVLIAATPNGLYRKTASDSIWSKENSGLNLNVSLYATALTQSGGNIFAAIEHAGIYVSSDGGNTWNMAGDSKIIGALYYALAANNGYVFTGTAAGVYRYSDSSVFWSVENIGLTDMNILCLTAGDSSVYAGSFGGGTFQTTNNGKNWLPTQFVALNVATSLASFDSEIFMGTFEDGIFRSTNDGGSWTPINVGLGQQGYVRAIIPFRKDLFIGTGGGVYRSSDTGSIWTAVNTGLKNEALDVYTIAASDSTLFGGTWGGSVYRSTNNGVIWQNDSIRSTNSNSVYTRSLFVYGNYIFAGTWGGGIYRSIIHDSNGLRWNVPDTAPSNQYIQSFAASGNLLFVGTDGGGVYMSKDSGNIWEAINYELTDTNAISLAVSGGYLFAGTETTVWKRSIQNILSGVNEAIAQAPTALVQLFSNYPNPFKTSTTISYFLPESVPVMLKVYNALGEEITTLVNGKMDVGQHSVSFSCDGLPNGVYFYRLTSGKDALSGEMAVVR